MNAAPLACRGRRVTMRRMLTPDKRDHYRLDDEVAVTWRPVTRIEVESTRARDHFETGPSFPLLKELYKLDLEARELLREMAPANKDLGNFLGNLNRRVELLARAMVAAEGERNSFDTPVRLSQGGISFLTDELLATGTCLALKLVFRESILGLTLFAEVRHCRLAEDSERYVVGTRFVRLDPGEEELIQRHIIHRQAEERRARLRGTDTP